MGRFPTGERPFSCIVLPMTLINHTFTRPGSNNIPITVSGNITCQPTRKRIIPGEPNTTVLPAPFTHPFIGTLQNLNLQPTTGEWCWKLTFKIPGVGSWVEHVLVPEVVTVDLSALTHVDPDTLDAEPETESIWWAKLEELIELGGIPGPPGKDSIVPGPPGKDSIVPGPPGKDSIIPGPPGKDSIVPGPPGKDGGVTLTVSNYGSGIDAIQNALNAAAEMSGIVTVSFPVGLSYDLQGTQLSVGEGTRIEGNGVIIKQSAKGAVSAFYIAPGISNVEIHGCDIRGPWYGINSDSFVGGGNLAVWNAEYADNIGINIQGRWHQRGVLKYPLAQMQELTDIHRNINIHNNFIEGFGQSGILADQIDTFRANDNNIYRNGRDGIRLYGVKYGFLSDNHIGDLFAAYADGLAPNFNMYGIAVTRLYGNAAYPDPLCTIGRPSQDIIVSNNHVFKCPTWKGLDTHGGVRITFANNIVEDCNIAIGLDKGGYDEITGYAPPRDVLIIGNTLRATPNTKYQRAGITAYGHDASNENVFDGLVITGNIFDGVGGGDTDGAIALSNTRNTAINGNTFRNSSRAALNCYADVQDFTFTGNTIDNPLSYITVTVNDGGTGYTARPAVNITGGGGAGMRAISLTANGSVTQIKILNPGHGYTTTPEFTLTGGSGTGASITPKLSPAFGVLSQATTVRGTIATNTFTNRNQTNMTAISLSDRANGYGVKISADNTYNGQMVQVRNMAAESGGTRKTTALAYGNVNMTDNALSLSAAHGITSIARGGVGNAQIRLNDGLVSATNTYTVTVTSKGTVPVVAVVNVVSTTLFNVRIFTLAGSAVDTGFYVTINGY